ncbi:MAG: glycosyltransferase [Muribaculaceae bacterium]|nr:glycosyltransferase [Muribaculaceae bacterium]
MKWDASIIRQRKIGMSKYCIIYNFAQQYRAPIFSLIDKALDCDWCFGRNTTDIKGMDTSLLKHVELVDNITVFRRPLYRQKSVTQKALSNEYDALILLGDLFNLSVWNILIRNKLFKHKKIYLWSHGWYGDEGFAKRILKKIFFGLADKVFLYGNYAKKVAIGQGFDESKLVVIHNSLDYEQQVKLREKLSSSDIYTAHFKNSNPVLLFIGRLTSVKRLDQLVDAVEILKERGEIYNVVFIGDGEQRLNLERQVSEKGLDDQFWFYGKCYDDTENAELIYNADLCVAPGNVGLTAMHTMVFGCPVLTHDDFSQQMPEFEAIQTGKTGAFFKRGDVLSLADSIERWFAENRMKRNQIRYDCYEEISKSWTPQYQLEVLKKNLEA